MADNADQARSAGPKLEMHQVLLRPLVTEKGTHQSNRHNAYPFQVSLWADKNQIKAAVQEFFNVRVTAVRTQTRLGKQRRYRNKMGRLPSWKKAIVTLHTEDKIEFVNKLSDTGLPAIEVSAFDGSIVPSGNAHVRPVDVSGLNVDDEAIGNSASCDDDLSIRAVGIY